MCGFIREGSCNRPEGKKHRFKTRGFQISVWLFRLNLQKNTSVFASGSSWTCEVLHQFLINEDKLRAGGRDEAAVTHRIQRRLRQTQNVISALVLLDQVSALPFVFMSRRIEQKVSECEGTFTAEHPDFIAFFCFQLLVSVDSHWCF